MTFLATETSDGLIHVQNYVGYHEGQHHVHTKESFEKWKNQGKTPTEVTVEKGECLCKLKAGDVREYDGQIWHNNKWE
jgi:hypothetical protein